MAYSDLTTEQKAVLTDYVRNLRAWAGEQARTNNHGDALNLGYNNMGAIFTELGDSEEIPDASGLGGAQTLTKAEVVTLTAHVQGILTNYNTANHRSLWAKAAGPSNLIG